MDGMAGQNERRAGISGSEFGRYGGYGARGTAGVLLGLSFRPDVFVYRRGAALGISAPPQDDAGRVRPSERRQGTGCGAAVWL